MEAGAIASPVSNDQHASEVMPEVLSLEAAIGKTQDVEDALRAKANLADEEIVKFQFFHNLSMNRDIWPDQFCDRLRFKNKRYRGKTKQGLADQAQELNILHTESQTGLNPYKHVTALADRAYHHCQLAYKCQEEVQKFYDTHIQEDSMLLQTQELTRRALRRAEVTVEQLRRDEEAIRTSYAIWKPCIALLSSSWRLSYSRRKLRERKLSKAAFTEDCTSLFAKLSSIIADRSKVRQEIILAGSHQIPVWLSMHGGSVSGDELACALQRYDGLEEKISVTHTAQRLVLQTLGEMYTRAQTTPDTLPGVDGVEIPVDNLLRTLKEYETLAARCNEAYTMAKSTLDDLRSVLSVV